MKKYIITSYIVLISTLLYAQEKIVINGFETRSNLSNKTEIELNKSFKNYRVFSISSLEPHTIIV